MGYIILVLVLFICLFTDIKSRKILNIVTLPTIVFGLVYNTFIDGFEGFLFSGKGFLIGLSLLLIPYLLGGMGAGDIKLFAAIGALMGTSFVLDSFIYTALIGGLIGLVLIIKQKGLLTLIKSSFYRFVFFRSDLGSIFPSSKKQSIISFPYGVAIVLGTLCTLVWGGF